MTIEALSRVLKRVGMRQPRSTNRSGGGRDEVKDAGGRDPSQFAVSRPPLTLHAPPEFIEESSPDDAVLRDIVLVDDRVLICDCLALSISVRNSNRVLTFPTVARWLAEAERHRPGGILLSLRGSLGSAQVQSELGALLSAAHPVPVIVLCDNEEPEQFVDALRRGVRGCIVTSIPFNVAAQAIRLVLAGGVYAPASILLAARAPAVADEPALQRPRLTQRQAEVLAQLCEGKTNREIAQSLDMRESTVKVHVRHVMRKLEAKNRTELAYIAKRLLNGVRN